MNAPSAVTLPSPVSTSSAPVIFSSLMEPSPVCTVRSPARSRPWMLPSPERRSSAPLIRSTSIDPSPLLACTSADAGIVTISFAVVLEKPNANTWTAFGNRTSTTM